MARYAAFLRGINVSGRRATSGQLRACFDGLGFTGVATYRASGNVVFEAPRGGPAELGRRIEGALAEALGYEVRTYLRTAREVRAIADHEPFPSEWIESSGGRLQVMLLPERPAARPRRAVLGLATDDDRLAFGERELYWLPSGRMMFSALDLDAIDRAIGPTTKRTKGTIDDIAGKYFATDSR
jgi:uncharacterized protein (DUF1697 family)